MEGKGAAIKGSWKIGELDWKGAGIEGSWREGRKGELEVRVGEQEEREAGLED